jgi:hypothetical protein
MFFFLRGDLIRSVLQRPVGVTHLYRECPCESLDILRTPSYRWRMCGGCVELLELRCSTDSSRGCRVLIEGQSECGTCGACGASFSLYYKNKIERGSGGFHRSGVCAHQEVGDPHRSCAHHGFAKRSSTSSTPSTDAVVFDDHCNNLRLLHGCKRNIERGEAPQDPPQILHIPVA